MAGRRIKQSNEMFILVWLRFSWIVLFPSLLHLKRTRPVSWHGRGRLEVTFFRVGDKIENLLIGAIALNSPGTGKPLPQSRNERRRWGFQIEILLKTMLCFGFYLEMLLYQQYSCHGHSLEYCSCQIYRSSTLIHHCIWLTNPTKLLSWKFQMFNYLYLRDYSRMCFQFVQSLIQHQNVAEPTVSFLLSRYFLPQKRQKVVVWHLINFESWSYLIFVTGAKGGARVNFFCQV